MADLIVDGLGRDFGMFRAVAEIGFEARDGEFVTLLGPSGCGKSTTLWMIAGLDRPTRGRIAIGDEVVADAGSGRFVAAEDRDFGLVFQTYALWPHMTVRQNLDFPLKLRGLRRAERQTRIEEALSLVELAEQIDKYPFQLSGGQQQRVALARTLVYRPRLLLLDEPLSNLDAKLRERSRVWLKDLQQQLGVTTLYVTHDQTEALAMSDRILVMRDGVIVQNGTPQEVYRSPADSFVADFIGSSNFLTGTADRNDAEGDGVVVAEGVRLAVPLPGTAEHGDSVTAAFRPERARLLGQNEAPSYGTVPLDATVLSRSYLGARYQLVVESAGLTFRIEVEAPPEGERARVAIPADAWMVFPAGSTPMAKRGDA